MKILERVAPQWALRRELARLQIERVRRLHEGASNKGRMQKFRAPAASPREESGDFKVLRERARHMYRNDGTARRAVKIIASYVCGTGISPIIKNSRGEKDPALQAAWNAWANSSSCDPRRRHNFYGIQRALMRTVVTTGECLLTRQTDPGMAAAGRVPLQLLALEGDWIDDSGDDQDKNISGIEFSQSVATGYHLYTKLPADGGGFESRLYPASQIIHCFDEERFGMVRGVSWLAPALVKLRDLDAYSDAELMRRKVAACFAAFVTHSPDTQIDDAELETFSQLEPGAVEFLEPGQNVTFSNPPNQTDYEPYIRAEMQRLAAGLSIPYEYLSGNLRDVNFSSARIGQIPFRRIVEEWQYLLLIPQVLDRVWEWWVESAVLSGLTSARGATADWVAPKMEMLDVEKETEAVKREIRNGVKSWSEAVRETGRDPDDVLKAIAEDAKRFDAAGIVLDSDPRYTNNNGRLHTDPGGQ